MSERVAAHLAQAYGITVHGLAELDRGVFRVDRGDAAAWVARVFPPARPVAAVEGDAVILDGLAAAGFPAERRVAEVSTLDGCGVLVTGFVEGARPQGRGRTFAILGGLLGALAARTVATARPGGAWHQLAEGGPADEIEAALALLQAHRGGLRGAAAEHCDLMLAHIAELDDAADLPRGFVHADFVPANAIETPDDNLVIVDWAGSGHGPRVWPLAYLLWAAGVRDLRLVDLVTSRYRRHLSLEPAELDRIEGLLGARPLLLDAWSVAHGRRTPAQAAASLSWARAQAAKIADRARAGLAA